MNKPDWDRVFPEVPQEFHAAVLRALEDGAESPEAPVFEERNRFMKRKPKFSLLLAAVILVCCIGAAAAAAARWNQEAARQFQADPAQQEALASAGAAALPQQTAEANGLTVTALQTVGDQSAVCVLFGIQPPEGIVLTDGNLFDNTVVALDGNQDLSWSGGFTPGEDGSGRWYYELWLNNAQGQDWQGKELSVTFTDLLAEPGEDQGKPELSTALEGVWSLSWPLTYSEQVQTLAAGTSGEVNGRAVTVTGVELSPLSMCIRLGGDGLEELIGNADLEHLGMLFTASLLLEDGTAFDACGGPSNENWSAGYTGTYFFGKVLDVERAASLVLTFPNEPGENTLTIPLS